MRPKHFIQKPFHPTRLIQKRVQRKTVSFKNAFIQRHFCPTTHASNTLSWWVGPRPRVLERWPTGGEKCWGPVGSPKGRGSKGGGRVSRSAPGPRGQVQRGRWRQSVERQRVAQPEGVLATCGDTKCPEVTMLPKFLTLAPRAAQAPVQLTRCELLGLRTG